MVLFTTTWNCIGNEDFSHPQITNNTHKCSFPGCHQKCPPFVNLVVLHSNGQVQIVLL